MRVSVAVTGSSQTKIAMANGPRMRAPWCSTKPMATVAMIQTPAVNQVQLVTLLLGVLMDRDLLTLQAAA